MASREMVESLDDPDASLQYADSRYLKQGNTCTLWQMQVDGRQLVVKRYNIKSFVHRLNRAFRQSQRRDMRRFMRNWDACPDVAVMFSELLRNRNLLTDT